MLGLVVGNQVDHELDDQKVATILHVFFFFQAEDGIRDVAVTGVQTCALPIYRPRSRAPRDCAESRPVISSAAGFSAVTWCSRSRPMRPVPTEFRITALNA